MFQEKFVLCVRKTSILEKMEYVIQRNLDVSNIIKEDVQNAKEISI